MGLAKAGRSSLPVALENAAIAALKRSRWAVSSAERPVVG
jgi:hypothetical protein